MTDNIRCNVKDCEAGMRLDQFLALKDQIVSRSQAQRLLKSGNVLVSGVSVSAPSRKVYSGQSIQLTFPENEHSKIFPEKGDIEILHEDSELLVINKPAGMPFPITSPITKAHLPFCLIFSSVLGLIDIKS